MIYRDPDARIVIGHEIAPKRTWWRWLRCFVLGHKWRIVRQNPYRTSALIHLHHMAGCDAWCRRCGSVWLDAGGLEP